MYNLKPLGSTKSSWIDSVAYNSDAKELTVELAGGRRYKFASVPASVPTAMEASGSWGTFFNQEIRGTYTMLT